MSGSKWFNPLNRDALTAADVSCGDQIICWQPGKSESTQHLTIVHGPHTDDDDNMVVVVRHKDGHETTELTSSVGLSGERYSGEWSHIAVHNEEETS